MTFPKTNLSPGQAAREAFVEQQHPSCPVYDKDWDAIAQAAIEAAHEKGNEMADEDQILDRLLGTRAAVAIERDALQARYDRLESAARTFTSAVIAVLAHKESPKTGMQVPFHGDFVSSPPSTLRDLRWHMRNIEAALLPPSSIERETEVTITRERYEAYQKCEAAVRRVEALPAEWAESDTMPNGWNREADDSAVKV